MWKTLRIGALDINGNSHDAMMMMITDECDDAQQYSFVFCRVLLQFENKISAVKMLIVWTLHLTHNNKAVRVSSFGKGLRLCSSKNYSECTEAPDGEWWFLKSLAVYFCKFVKRGIYLVHFSQQDGSNFSLFSHALVLQCNSCLFYDVSSKNIQRRPIQGGPIRSHFWNIIKPNCKPVNKAKVKVTNIVHLIYVPTS